MRKIQPVRKGSFINRVMRAIGINSGLELHGPSEEESQTGISIYYPHYDYHKEVMNAMLEAEKSKAEAIMRYQRRNLPQ
jgi:hypothetical protein